MRMFILPSARSLGFSLWCSRCLFLSHFATCLPISPQGLSPGLAPGAAVAFPQPLWCWYYVFASLCPLVCLSHWELPHPVQESGRRACGSLTWAMWESPKGLASLHLQGKTLRRGGGCLPFTGEWVLLMNPFAESAHVQAFLWELGDSLATLMGSLPCLQGTPIHDDQPLAVPLPGRVTTVSLPCACCAQHRGLAGLPALTQATPAREAQGGCAHGEQGLPAALSPLPLLWLDWGSPGPHMSVPSPNPSPPHASPTLSPLEIAKQWAFA